MKMHVLRVVSLLLLTLFVPSLESSALRTVPETAGRPFGFVDGPEWTWQNPLPQGNTLNAVWGTGPEDVYAVGERGVILHYDGRSWTPMTSNFDRPLNGIWSSGPSDVFAVSGERRHDGAYRGSILQYDGSAWREVVHALDNSLESVWGTSDSDVFAVGSNGTILHYSGTEWSEMNSGTDAYLHAVWGASGGDVFAVGSNGTILHYDGGAWRAMDSGTDESLQGVWGSSGSDVFVVGGRGAILHYDGSSWKMLQKVNAVSLHGVSGTAPDDVLAVGRVLDEYASSAYYALFHYDGREWSEVMRGSTVWLDLYGIWTANGNCAFAVGSYGTILSYDGDDWIEITSIVPQDFRAIWGSSGDDVFAVGGLYNHINIIHYDGNEWRAMSSGTTRGLSGLWASSPHNVFAVGPGGTLLRYDGQVWSPMDSGIIHSLFDVWGSRASDVYAVGETGRIVHYNGARWNEMNSGTTDLLLGVWGSGPNDVFVVGGHGGRLLDSDVALILHFDGTEWSEMYSGGDRVLEAVWGSGPNDVFAVGSQGAILHYDGQTWREMNGGTSEELRDVWGSGPDDVFAVGSGGTILHYDGATWSEMTSGTFNSLTAVWGSGPDGVFVGGEGGTILQYGSQVDDGDIDKSETRSKGDVGHGSQPQATTGNVKWIARVSVASDGTQANGGSGKPSISGDGRYVAFDSLASNLILGDTNETRDVFVHDLRTRETLRVSVSSAGSEADGSSGRPSISADGRYVAFSSGASNLVSLDTNEEADVFVHDLKTGETTRVSVSSAGEEGNGGSSRPSISGDGRYVAFVSTATNLVATDTNSCGNATEGRCPDAFIHDRETGQTELVSVASDGTQADGETAYESLPDLSDNGRFAVFNSWAPLTGQRSSLDQVYIRDREEGVTELVNPDYFIPAFAWYPSISADGRYVAFVSKTFMTINGEGNLCRIRGSQECAHVYVRDMESGEFVRISKNSQGEQAIDGSSALPQISADGNFVVFTSVATNLVTDDTNEFCEYDSYGGADDNCSDVFLHNLSTAETFRVSLAPDGTQANDGSGSPSVSSHGERVAFTTPADNLVESDTNDAGDVFVVGLTQDSPPSFLVEEAVPEAPTPAPESGTGVGAEDLGPSAPTVAPDRALPAQEADALDQEGRELRRDLVATLRENPVWLIGGVAGLLGILGAIGVIAAIVIARHRPSASRLVWIGCGGGVVLLLFVAAVGVAAVGIGSRWQETTSSDIEPMPTSSPAELAKPTPLSSTGAEPQPTSTRMSASPESGTVTPATDSPTLTPKPSPTVDPLAACAEAPQQGLQVGDKVAVCTKSDRLKVRDEPARSGAEVLLLDPGSALTIVAGPVCADGWLWWEVRTESDETGWVAEGGDEIDPYFICETQACDPITGTFAGIWPGVQADIGCAIGPSFQGLVAEERFEGGIMLWREAFDTGRVPVLFDGGTWRYYSHTPFGEGSPEFPCVDENTPPECPPTPKRGFGTMWCEIAEVRTRLGNALDCERGYQATMQRFTDGFMLLNDRGMTYVLSDNETWRAVR